MPIVFNIFDENKLEIMFPNISISYYEYLSVLRQANYDSKFLRYNFYAHFDIKSWMPIVFTIFNENKWEIVFPNISISYYEYLSVLKQLNYDYKFLRFNFYAHFDIKSWMPTVFNIFDENKWEIVFPNISISYYEYLGVLKQLSYDSKYLRFNFYAHFDIKSWRPIVFTIFDENNLKIVFPNISISYYEYLSVLKQLNYDSKYLRYHFYAHFDIKNWMPIVFTIFNENKWEIMFSNISMS